MYITTHFGGWKYAKVKINTKGFNKGKMNGSSVSLYGT